MQTFLLIHSSRAYNVQSLTPLAAALLLRQPYFIDSVQSLAMLLVFCGISRLNTILLQKLHDWSLSILQPFLRGPALLKLADEERLQHSEEVSVSS